MLIWEEGNFLVCALTWCLCFGALFKDIALVSLPQLGISTLLAKCPNIITGLGKRLLPFLHQCLPAHKNVWRKAVSWSRAVFLPNGYTVLFLPSLLCIQILSCRNIISKILNYVLLSAYRILKIFTTIFSRWHKIRMFGFFTCINISNWFKYQEST